MKSKSRMLLPGRRKIDDTMERRESHCPMRIRREGKQGCTPGRVWNMGWERSRFAWQKEERKRRQRENEKNSGTGSADCRTGIYTDERARP